MPEMSEGELKKWSQLVAQAWSDEKLKQRLLKDPSSVLREHGIDVAAGVEIRVVENTDKVRYLTLPAKPTTDVTELNDEDLTAVAGGLAFTFVCRACRTQDFEFPPLFLQGT